MTPDHIAAERRLLRLLYLERIAQSPGITSTARNLSHLGAAIRVAWDTWDAALKAAYEFQGACERRHTFTGTEAAE